MPGWAAGGHTQSVRHGVVRRTFQVTRVSFDARDSRPFLSWNRLQPEYERAMCNFADRLPDSVNHQGEKNEC